MTLGYILSECSVATSVLAQEDLYSLETVAEQTLYFPCVWTGLNGRRNREVVLLSFARRAVVALPTAMRHGSWQIHCLIALQGEGTNQQKNE